MRALVAIAFAFVIGCTSARQSQDPAEEAWSSADYANVGLRVDKPWTADDYSNAARVLQQHSANHRERLPRFGGKRTGALFAKLLTDLPDDAGAPTSERFLDHAKRSEAINAISKLYMADATAPPSREWIELMAAILREAVILTELSGEFLASFGPDDPQREVRLEGLAKMKAGYGSMVLGGLLVADQLRLPEDDRIAMLRHVTAALPVIFPIAEPDTQRAIRTLIQKQVAAFPAGKLHDAAASAQRALPN